MMNRKKIEKQLKRNYICDFMIWLGAAMLLAARGFSDHFEVMPYIILTLLLAVPGAILFAILYAVKMHQVFGRSLPLLDESEFTDISPDLALNRDYLVYYRNLNYIFVPRAGVTDISTTAEDGKAQAILTLTTAQGKPFSYIYSPAKQADLYDKIAAWTQLNEVCPKCGAVNPPGSQFCGNCGASLRPEVKPEPEKDTTATIMIIVLLIVFIIVLIIKGVYGL
jgi:predicted nucleic acid-binding Zn ribbon protein